MVKVKHGRVMRTTARPLAVALFSKPAHHPRVDAHACINPQRPACHVGHAVQPVGRPRHDLEDVKIGDTDTEAGEHGQQLVPAVHVEALQAEEQNNGEGGGEDKQRAHVISPKTE